MAFADKLRPHFERAFETVVREAVEEATLALRVDNEALRRRIRDLELDRDASEPVEVLVNRCLVARGEVVVVEGNYGVRIQQIVSRQDRLRSIR